MICLLILEKKRDGGKREGEGERKRERKTLIGCHHMHPDWGDWSPPVRTPNGDLEIEPETF